MYRSTLLSRPHAFTGVDDGDFMGAPPDPVGRLLARLQGQRLAMLRQVHGDGISVVGDGFVEGDALITADPGQVVAVRVADCVPILIEGRAGDRWLVAAVHAGWRGTAADIVRHTLQRLAALGAAPAMLRAAVGPAIGPCCYGVGEEVIDGLSRVAAAPGWREGRQVDLRKLNLDILRAAGVQAEQVGPCTRCTPGLWSHRRDPAGAGRQVGAICA